jgi:two-component system, response regulator PdtaR
MIILIAEDQEIVAMMLAWQLEAAGHYVLRPVATLRDAEVLATQEAPDLALIDIGLRGGENGISLARKLQSELQIPCVFITAEPAAARANADAALGVIVKPYSPNDLNRSIHALSMILLGVAPHPNEIPAALELFAQAS